MKKLNIPVILVLNKIDLINKGDILPMIGSFCSLHDFEAIIPISAKKNDGVAELLVEIEKLLKAGPKFYPDDMITDQPEKQMMAEIIREKLLWSLEKEIPHGVAIEIVKMKDGEKNYDISANIYCEKKSHKGIIIGKDGEMLKKIGTQARMDMEKSLSKKVFLELWVKPKEDWRNNNYLMKSFGYEI